jgi:Spermine/spermidine synthase domain
MNFKKTSKMKTYDDRFYTPLSMVYPNKTIESATYLIEPFSLTKERVRQDKMYALMDGNGWTTNGLKHDYTYVRLVLKGEGVMMSDTPMERNTNMDFVKRANGDVLIFGLGLGLIIIPLLQAEEVTSVTVVELHQDLIELVEPFLKEIDGDNKLTIVQGDCFEYHETIPKDKKWDCIYGDIWISISSSNWDEMELLTRKYKWRLKTDNPNTVLDHWMKDYVKETARKIRDESREFQHFMGMG